MKIADKVKIGGFVYDVQQKEDSFVGTGGTALDGEHIFSQKKIILGGAGCVEYRELVFIHEICHGIIEAFVSPSEHDEKFVEQFSKGLYQVLVDNPNIFNTTEKGGDAE
jgi:hypothetical protein